MRAKVLVIFWLFLASSACASLPIKKNTIAVDRYDIVSVDTSICGKVGTLPVQGEMELSVNRNKYFIRFIIPGGLGDEGLNSYSEAYFYGKQIAFKFQDFSLIGTFRLEERVDGKYFVINLPASSDTLAYEEEELMRYKGYKDFDASSLVREQEQKIEKLRNGFDWVFKKK